jgi:hypothetical protein
VASTAAPVPVTDVKPVAGTNPVAFVNVSDVGVSSAGLVREGLFDPTKLPVPVVPDNGEFTLFIVLI